MTGRGSTQWTPCRSVQSSNGGNVESVDMMSEDFHIQHQQYHVRGVPCFYCKHCPEYSAHNANLQAEAKARTNVKT
jgi:YgiT-type zinc finger domain-containing protein